MKNVRKNMSAIALLALAMSALMPQKAQAQERIPFWRRAKHGRCSTMMPDMKESWSLRTRHGIASLATPS